MAAELFAGFASSCSSVTDAQFDVYTADVTLATKQSGLSRGQARSRTGT
jgi:hypothetical protein